MLQPNTNISSKYCQKTRYNYVRSSVFWGSSSTGKERDSETGFSYFGARYYDSDILTGWLSVDPLADKYPSLSPYAYCAWNPIRLIDPDGEQVQRPPLRYGVFNSNQRFVTSNMRQTVYRNSSSTNVKYTRSGCRPVSHDNSMPTYINSKRINEIESQYNMKTKYSKYEEIAKLIVDAKEFVSKAKENTNYSVVYKETNIYTDLENKSTSSYDIVFDNPNIQEKYNSLQNGWNEAYNYIKENYSITAPNGLRHLSSEGLGKMLELGNSPKTQLINHFKKNKSDYRIVERKNNVIPSIIQN